MQIAVNVTPDLIPLGSCEEGNSVKSSTSERHQSWELISEAGADLGCPISLEQQ